MGQSAYNVSNKEILVQKALTNRFSLVLHLLTCQFLPGWVHLLVRI